MGVRPGRWALEWAVRACAQARDNPVGKARKCHEESKTRTGVARRSDESSERRAVCSFHQTILVVLFGNPAGRACGAAALAALRLNRAVQNGGRVVNARFRAAWHRCEHPERH
eukprot:344517-Chlamydomonas_euryale.AAC.11